MQTLPEREGDPEPPPDNGQHIALGCFTEYLKLPRADRRGRDDIRRLPLELTVIDERGRAAKIGYGLGPLLRYRHLPLRDRARGSPSCSRGCHDRRRARARRFGEFLRRHGQTATGDRALLGRLHPPRAQPAAPTRSSAEAALLHRHPALARRAGAASDLVLPTAPLGQMHGEAAGRALEAGRRARADRRARGRSRRARCRRGDPRRAARGGVAPARRGLARSSTRRSSASICSSTASSFASPWLRCSAAHAHWIFDRGAADRARAGPRPISDCRVERRPRAARDPRPRAGRPDRRSGDRATGCGRGPLVACEPGARGDDRGATRPQQATGRPATSWRSQEPGWRRPGRRPWKAPCEAAVRPRVCCPSVATKVTV